MRKFLVATIMLVWTLWIAVPQLQASVYTWSKYNLTFETPDGGFVTYSTATRFEMQWDDMMFTIQLYNKDKSNDKDLKENLTRKAMGYNMYDTKHGKMKVKGFKPVYIEGTMPDGSRAVIADLVSNNQNLIVEVTVQYLFGNRETVDDIIKSFAEGKAENYKEKKHKQKVQTKEDADRQDKDRRQEQDRREKQRNRKTFDA
ncbi:hypothetical protein [Sodaliphilus sp.]|uniref:hypothetical protein n=1 Tax=Sodaliphilus sp. TaxID=2815818 RepID=UPI00388F9667